MLALPRQFYLRSNVLLISRELLGKHLVTRFNGKLTSGMIVETEAYEGVEDKASHAYGNRKTARTEVMYRIGGTAYVYLCYGIHSLFNVVTNAAGIPHAVLIRGIIPSEGLDLMLERTGKSSITNTFGIGPGKVSRALGIHYSHTGHDLTLKPAGKNKDGIWIEDRGFCVEPENILITPRIGVEYSGGDAMRPNRFFLRT